jgi:hypothetical protein
MQKSLTPKDTLKAIVFLSLQKDKRMVSVLCGRWINIPSEQPRHCIFNFGAYTFEDMPAP